MFVSSTWYSVLSTIVVLYMICLFNHLFAEFRRDFLNAREKRRVFFLNGKTRTTRRRPWLLVPPVAVSRKIGASGEGEGIPSSLVTTVRVAKFFRSRSFQEMYGHV